MNANVIATIQKIEDLAQMQYCAEGYLDAGHSIYAAYDVDDLDGLLFHGTYTDYDTLLDGLDAYNGSSLADVAKFLFCADKITAEELRAVNEL